MRAELCTNENETSQIDRHINYDAKILQLSKLTDVTSGKSDKSPLFSPFLSRRAQLHAKSTRDQASRQRSACFWPLSGNIQILSSLIMSSFSLVFIIQKLTLLTKRVFYNRHALDIFGTSDARQRSHLRPVFLTSSGRAGMVVMDFFYFNTGI